MSLSLIEKFKRIPYVNQKQNRLLSLSLTEKFKQSASTLWGKKWLQYTFWVLSQDMQLEKDILTVTRIEDRWLRREGWRANYLAGLPWCQLTYLPNPVFILKVLLQNIRDNGFCGKGIIPLNKDLWLREIPWIFKIVAVRSEKSKCGVISKD